MAQTAELLGEDEDAAHFRRLHERVRTAFRREFVTATGRVVNETATAYALAIMFGILDDEQLQKAGDRLAELVAQAAYRISTGFAGTPLVAHALSRTGHLEEAYSLLLQRECPSFLYPVTMGATTIWERWDAVLPDGTVNATGMTSLNHYALGAVADWMHGVVAGLTRAAPGWQQIRISPQPGGGLTSARASHDTIHGRVASAWHIDGTDLVLEVTVPQGTSATVVLPLHPENAIEEVAAGSYSWRYPLPAGYGVAPELTMDTPIGQIRRDPVAWAAVTEVLRTHFPGVPLDAAGPRVDAMSLNAVVERVPGSDSSFGRDLRHALASGRT